MTQTPTVIEELDAAWSDLVTATDAIPHQDWQRLADPAGWTVADHVAHVTLWQAAIAGKIAAGTPFHETFGIPAPEWDWENCNEQIRALRRNADPAALIAERDQVHARVRGFIATLPAALLSQSAKSLGLGDHSIEEAIRHDLADHFREHLGYIKVIAESATT